MRLVGTIEAKADSKGRVFLPAVFRRALMEKGEAKLVMRKDVFTDCLVLYPEEVWNKRLDELKARLSPWNKKEQAMLRKYLTDAEWVNLDSNGRILISKRYQKITEIETDVVFVGLDEVIEVWAKHKFAEQQSDDTFAQDIEEIMNPSKEL